MKRILLPADAGFPVWRDRARAALQAGLAPGDVVWQVQGAEQAELFPEEDAPLSPVGEAVGHITRPCLVLLKSILRHSDPERFALAYRILWRSQQEPHLPAIATDPDIRQATQMDRQIRRDAHKMKAFLRFREVVDDASARRRFIAWFEPEHFILETVAPFFAERFSDMDWLILTPIGAIAACDGRITRDSEPREAPELTDDVEGLWHRYYQSIFNPARIKTKAMRSEMPVRYWKNLPETRLIPTMLADAGKRVAAMAAQQAEDSAARGEIPAFHARHQAEWSRRKAEEHARVEGLEGLPALAAALRGCDRCDLCRHATQVVPGAGPAGAALMMIGEQPGDQEDLHGTPFVGPAGAVLDRVLERVGIARESVYLTNAVKHFKFVSKGRRRIHQTPGRTEVVACSPWLQQEIALVRPRLIVTLGATALQTLEGPSARLGSVRGRVRDATAQRPPSLATVHPSYLLRLPDAQRAQEEEARFARELIAARDWLESDRDAAPSPGPDREPDPGSFPSEPG